MECSECRTLFSPYYDGELKDPQAAQLIEHMRSCGECKQEFAKYTESLAALKSLAGELNVPGVALSVRDAVLSSRANRAARWHQLVVNDMKVVSEMLRPARGGLIFLATVAAAALFVIILTYSLTSPGQPPVEERTAGSDWQETPEPAPVRVPQVSQEGMVRIDGEWMTKDDALAQMLEEKGLRKSGDWFLPEEDATNLAMGMQFYEGRWLTPEELARQLGTSSQVAAAKEPAEVENVPEPEKQLEPPQDTVAKQPGQPAPLDKPKTERRKVTERPVTDNGVAAFLSTVLLDEIESHDGLTLCTLTRQEQEWEGKREFYITLADAVERGIAEIRETGKVNKLVVKKDSDVAIIALGGGIVIGGWQNRLIGPDVYLSADVTEATLDVYCAEQGRWAGSKAFSVAEYLAVSELRKKSYNAEEQDYIWKSIKEIRKSQKVYSLNKSYHKLYEKRTVKKQVAAVEKAFSDLKERLKNKPHTIGIAVLVNGEIVAADLFVNNHLLMRYMDQLLRTYAVDAVIAQAGGKPTPAEKEVRERVGEFIATAARSTYASTGDETYLEYRITDEQTDLFGYALSASNVPIHVSLFGDSRGLRQQETVARRPKDVVKADDDKTDSAATAKKKKVTLEEAAAAKLRKEGKIKPTVPLPPAPPSPPAPPAPKNIPPRGRYVIPRLPGR
jgi:shikimate kinase